MDLSILLYGLGPLIILAYKVLEHYGFWNYISGRKHAVKGLERLKTTTGYPVGWIYNDESDKKEFSALLKRIKKNTTVKTIQDVLKDGNVPSIFITGGSPIVLEGLPSEWEQKDRTYYSPNHPILMIFGITRGNNVGAGKTERCCSLGELEKWINDEKKQWDFWLGAVVITILSLASIILRLEISGQM